MAKPGATGIKRIVAATKYSLQGLKSAWQNEAAFRQELILSLVLVPVALYFGDTALEKALLISSCLLVLIVEILNSAIEAVVDRVGSEHHELSGRAKDMASAAVFLSFCFAAVMWAGVLIK